MELIEITIIRYLGEALGVPVVGEFPPGPDARCVLIEKIGGDRENRIESGTFRFSCYAESLAEAARLCRRCRNAVDTMPESLDRITACEFGGDYNDTDTATKKHCYSVLYTITFY